MRFYVLFWKRLLHLRPWSPSDVMNCALPLRHTHCRMIRQIHPTWVRTSHTIRSSALNPFLNRGIRRSTNHLNLIHRSICTVCPCRLRLLQQFGTCTGGCYFRYFELHAIENCRVSLTEPPLFFKLLYEKIINCNYARAPRIPRAHL